MDRLIEALDAVIDGDLALCEGEGVAYQVDRSHRVQYGPDYFAKVAAYEGGEIARRVIDGRLALAARHARPGARLLDYGCGSGEFLRAALAAGFDARGFDVMAETRDWLASRALWADNPAAFEIVTAWDVIEHLENPAELLARIVPGAIRCSNSGSGPSANGNSATTISANNAGFSASPRRRQTRRRSRETRARQADAAVPKLTRQTRVEFAAACPTYRHKHHAR